MNSKTMTVPAISKREVPASAVKQLAPALGELFIAWAFLDQAIEMWLVELGYEAVKRKVASKMPEPFADRVKTLKSCFRRMQELSEWTDEAISLLDRAAALANHRHMLTHGTLSHWIEHERAIIFIKLRFARARGFHIAEQDGYTVDTLDEMAAEARDLVGAMMQLKAKFNDTFD